MGKAAVLMQYLRHRDADRSVTQALSQGSGSARPQADIRIEDQEIGTGRGKKRRGIDARRIACIAAHADHFRLDGMSLRQFHGPVLGIVVDDDHFDARNAGETGRQRVEQAGNDGCAVVGHNNDRQGRRSQAGTSVRPGLVSWWDVHALPVPSNHPESIPHGRTIVARTWRVKATALQVRGHIRLTPA